MVAFTFVFFVVIGLIIIIYLGQHRIFLQLREWQMQLVAIFALSLDFYMAIELTKLIW